MSGIYIVVLESWVDETRKMAEAHGIDKAKGVIAGGGSALDSIYLGLKQMVADRLPSDTIVEIHDGVRPIITESMIRANAEATVLHGNAITCIPAFETMALCKSGSLHVEHVVDRKRAYTLQAPQTFRLGEAYAINARAQDEQTVGQFVDQANMHDYYGVPLRLIEGIRGNVKITIPDDVSYFTYLVESGEYARMIGVLPEVAR